jgi:hypothetical protein
MLLAPLDSDYVFQTLGLLLSMPVVPMTMQDDFKQESLSSSGQTSPYPRLKLVGCS